MKHLNINGFAKLVGSTSDVIENLCGEMLNEYDFSYSILNGEVFESTLLKVLKIIDDHDLPISGEGRHPDWEKGWSENLTRFKNSNFDLQSLVPGYMHKYPEKRLFGNYIKPTDPNFEVNLYTVYRNFIFKNYLNEYDSVYEFGCGTGYNLAILAQIFPEKSLHGLDWAKSSNQIVENIAKAHNFNITPHHFDFFNPDQSLEIGPDSAFITFNSLEQLGSDHNSFLDFILSKKPSICINSEPLYELYEDEDLLDYLAIKYHRKRNYLKGYLDSLRELEQKGRVKILKEQRVRSGNLFHEGYSIVVWEILNQ